MAKEGSQRGDTANFSPDYESEGSDPSSTVRREHASEGIEGLLKQCEILLKELMLEDSAGLFNTPVDPVKRIIPGYFDVIKNPMDLGTINSKLSSGEYTSHLDFLDDVKLTFTNAKTYNKHVLAIADKMSQSFEARWEAIEKELTASASQNLERPDKTEIAKPLPASKAAKLSGLLDDHLRQEQRSITNSEAYEIEVQKLSGHSNSQVNKDNARMQMEAVAAADGVKGVKEDVKEDVKEGAVEAKGKKKPNVDILTRMTKRELGVHLSEEELIAQVDRTQKERKLNEEQNLRRVFEAIEIFTKRMDDGETVHDFLERMMIHGNLRRRYSFYHNHLIRIGTRFEGCDVMGWGVVDLEARKDEILAKFESKNY